MEKRFCHQDRRSDQCCWSDLPIDQLREVADRLSYLDFLRFGVVCKQWRRASLDDGNNKIQHRRAMFLLRIAKPTQHYYHDRPELKTTYLSTFVDLLSKRRLGFYNSVWEERRQYKHPPARFCCSYSDWLLFLIKSDTGRSDRIFLILDVFGEDTLQVNLLPPLDCNCGHWKVELASFSTAPASPGSVIFFLWKSTAPRSCYEEGEGEEYHYFPITTDDLEYRRWSLYQLPCVNPNDYDFKEVAYADGSFYVAIDMNSKVVLGSFNVALQEWVMMNNSTSTLRLPSRPTHLYLANSDRKFLLAVFYNKDQQGREFFSPSEKRGRELFCHIYQFDLSQRNWIRVKNLGNRVLLLCTASSIAVSAASTVASKFANMIVRYSSCDFVLEKYTCNSVGEWGFAEKG